MKLPYGLHCAKYCFLSRRFRDLFGDLLVSDWENKIWSITKTVSAENDAYNDNSVNIILAPELSQTDKNERKSIITRIKTAMGS